MNKIGVMNVRDPNAYKCCFCCHVKVGTILYGLLCLMVNIFALGVVVLLSIHPDILVPQRQVGPGRGPEFDGIHVDDFEHQLQASNDRLDNHVFDKEDLCVVYAVLVLSILMAVALLYGIIRNRPGYMVPFFCLQVFLFCMSCFSLISCLTYTSHFSVKMWFRDSGLSKLHGMEHVDEIDTDYLTYFVITMMILGLCFKAYLINMTWSCYKYVQQMVVARSMTREYQVDPDTEMLLPPRYEDAIKTQGNTQPLPPPPYTQ